jgi:hypothetical protein
MNRTGQVLAAASVAAELGVEEIDGRSPKDLTIGDV